MKVRRQLSVVLLAAVSAGCHTGIFAKRDAEQCCPTDIRKTVPWCAGEDAIFQCPCAPSADFYGHKPTCWRTWPAPGAIWRDMYCGGVGAPGCQPAHIQETPVILDGPSVLPPPEPVIPSIQPDESQMNETNVTPPAASAPVDARWEMHGAYKPATASQRLAKKNCSSATDNSMAATSASRQRRGRLSAPPARPQTTTLKLPIAEGVADPDEKLAVYFNAIASQAEPQCHDSVVDTSRFPSGSTETSLGTDSVYMGSATPASDASRRLLPETITSFVR